MNMVSKTEEAATAPPAKYDIENFVMAAGTGDAAVVEMFLTKWPQSINARDSKTWTALMRAAWFGQESIAVLLLKQGAAAHETDRFNRTARYLAGQRGPRNISNLIQEAVKKESGA
jgi:uncharacterized protein